MVVILCNQFKLAQFRLRIVIGGIIQVRFITFIQAVPRPLFDYLEICLFGRTYQWPVYEFDIVGDTICKSWFS